MKWLNSLPEVQAVLAAEFEGKPIREQNLSEWRKLGYVKWEHQQEALDMLVQLDDDVLELQPSGAAPLGEQLAVWLTARMLVAFQKLAEKNPDGELDLKVLRELLQDVVAVRRGDNYAGRLRLDKERFAEACKADIDRGLDALADEVKRWPDVKQALRDVIKLFKQRMSGESSASQPASDPSQNELNQTESNQFSEGHTPSANHHDE